MWRHVPIDRDHGSDTLERCAANKSIRTVSVTTWVRVWVRRCHHVPDLGRNWCTWSGCPKCVTPIQFRCTAANLWPSNTISIEVIVVTIASHPCRLPSNGFVVWLSFDPTTLSTAKICERSNHRKSVWAHSIVKKSVFRKQTSENVTGPHRSGFPSSFSML